MKMKRGLILTLCAVALGAFAQTAMAQLPTIDVSLNLRYNDPANPAEGGKFYVVAQSNATTGPGGLAGLSVNISNIDSASAVFGVAASENGYAATTRAQINDTLAPAGNSPYKLTSGGFVNLVYGQDVTQALITNIGKGASTPGNIATDPLRNTAVWNNSTLLFSGSFGATRPAFGTGNDANVFNTATTTSQATVLTSVRGDSVASLGLNTPATQGLRIGDRNRDGAVNLSTDILPALANIGKPAQGWDQGDFNNSGTVNVSADILPALAQIGLPALPPATPAVAAVPEPTTVGLALVGMTALGIFRKRFA
jgi:hypothetical protein